MQMYVLYFKSIQLLRHSYEAIFLPALKEAEFADSLDSAHSEKSVVSVMTGASLVIDHLARSLKISRKLACLNQKKPPFSDYIENQSWVIVARNKIQHINDEIKTDGSGPILGSVLWINTDGDHYIVSMKSRIKNETIPGLIIETRTGKTTMNVAYVHNDKYLDLETAYKSAINLSEHVRTSLVIKDKNGNACNIFNDVIHIKFRLQIVPNNDLEFPSSVQIDRA